MEKGRRRSECDLPVSAVFSNTQVPYFGVAFPKFFTSKGGKGKVENRKGAERTGVTATLRGPDDLGAELRSKGLRSPDSKLMRRRKTILALGNR